MPLVLLLALISAHRIEQKTSIMMPSGMAAPPVQTTTLFWDGARMRTDNGTEQSSIIEYDTDRIVFINHAAKEYSETKISTVLKTFKDAFDDMKNKMKNMPLAERQALDSLNAKLDIEKTNDTQKIIGFDARRFRLKQRGRDAGEVWYSKAIDMKDIAPYAKRFAELTRSMAGNNWAEVLTRVENGFALRSTVSLEIMGQRAAYTTETTKYEKVASQPDRFVVPADYKKVAPPKMSPAATP